MTKLDAGDGLGQPQKRCKNKKCRKLFTPNPSRKNQQYCNPRCQNRAAKDRANRKRLIKMVKSVRCEYGHCGVRIPGELDLRKRAS